MTNKYFQNKIEQNINEISEVITNAFNQILNKEFEMQVTFPESSQINSDIVSESYPKIAVTFNSGTAPKVIRHVLLLEPDFLLKFYAWMLMDEPAAEISDEHFDGLKEGLEQVFGQLKMAVSDEKGVFNFTDLAVHAAEDFSSVQSFTLETEGSIAQYSLSAEGETFTLKQYIWPEQLDLYMEKAEPEMSNELDQFSDQSGMPVDVQSAQFGDLSTSSGGAPGEKQNVSMLLDVDLEIRVEIDRKQILVSDLLKIGKGSIIELEKSAGEPLDVYVNGRKFAEGEVVVVDDKFGIRITQLISPKERVQSLGAAF